MARQANLTKNKHMVNRNLIRDLEDDVISQELEQLFQETDETLYDRGDGDVEYNVNKIVVGRIVRVDDEVVVIDVGFKSEGTVHLNEWDEHEDAPEVGQTVKVLIEDMEDELGQADDPFGLVAISKRKAQKIADWINDSIATPTARADQALTKLVPGRDLVDVMEKDLVPKIILTPPERKHLQDDWFDRSTGWWPGHQPVQPIVRQGLRQACNRVSAGNLPLDCYWVCAGNIFEAWATESKFQVTLILATPPPEAFLNQGLTRAEPIWVTRSYLEPGDKPDGQGQDPSTGVITVRCHNQP